MKRCFTIFFLVIFSNAVFAQTTTPGVTVGLLYSDQSQVAPGYLLFTPQFSNKGYLIDMCGEVVNDWTFSGDSNYSGFYLMDDGSVVKFITSWGGTAAYGDGCFERRDWNNNLVWQYCGTGAYSGLHSDLYPLPNGNFLAVMQDSHTFQQAIAKGLDPSQIGNNYDTESVLEIQPVGTNGGNIVWEWHIWDHIVQDFNANVPSTYGVISNNPGRYDGHLIFSNMHVNSIYYNQSLDHIVISSWKDSEIYIIDHNTTTAQAAGPMGDFLFRWGNPQNYDRGTAADKKLFGQHNPKWVKTSYPNHGGKISIYNNRYGELPGINLSNQSSVVVIDPVWDATTGQYQMDASGKYLPTTYDYVWAGDVINTSNLYSSIMSGADVQANGNIMICEATRGRISEVTNAGNVVWVYQCPDSNGTIINQGNNSNADVYKMDKYDPSHPGLAGRDLTPYGPIENTNPLTDACELAACNLTLSVSGLPTSTSSSTPISLIGSPAGGTFSGNGVVFNAFNPVLAGPGIHVVSYTYDDGNGCMETIDQNILVFNIIYNFVNYSLGTISPRYGGTIDVNVEVLEPGNFTLQMMDMNGQMIYSDAIEFSNKGTHQTTMEVPSMKAGTYLLNIINDETMATKKLLIH